MLFAAGCFGSGESGKESEGAESASGEQEGAKQAKQAIEEGAPGEANESEEAPAPKPDRPPGWTVSTSGAYVLEVSDQSILRKYTSNAGDSEQIVLAGDPVETGSSEGRMTFTLPGLSENGEGEYSAVRAVAAFNSIESTCSLGSGDGEKETGLRVEVTRDDTVFSGSFEGTLECPDPDGEEEPKYIEVEGEYVDY